MMNDWFIHSILKPSYWRQSLLEATVFRWFSKVWVASCKLRVGAKVHLKRELRVGFCELRVGFYELLKKMKSSNSQKSTRIFDVQLVLLICNSHFWCSTRTFDVQLALLMFNSHFWCSISIFILFQIVTPGQFFPSDFLYVIKIIDAKILFRVTDFLWEFNL